MGGMGQGGENRVVFQHGKGQSGGRMGERGGFPHFRLSSFPLIILGSEITKWMLWVQGGPLGSEDGLGQGNENYHEETSGFRALSVGIAASLCVCGGGGRGDCESPWFL